VEKKREKGERTKRPLAFDEAATEKTGREGNYGGERRRLRRRKEAWI